MHECLDMNRAQTSIFTSKHLRVPFFLHSLSQLNDLGNNSYFSLPSLKNFYNIIIGIFFLCGIFALLYLLYILHKVVASMVFDDIITSFIVDFLRKGNLRALAQLKLKWGWIFPLLLVVQLAVFMVQYDSKKPPN